MIFINKRFVIIIDLHQYKKLKQGFFVIFLAFKNVLVESICCVTAFWFGDVIISSWTKTISFTDKIPFNFFKKIIVFTSDSRKEKIEIERMKKWLMRSGYPSHVVEKGLHNAKLQGPAPNPSKKKDIIPFVTQNSSNFSCNAVTRKLKQMIEHCPDEDTKLFFR